METLIVACVQQKMRLPRSQAEHKDDLRRFLRSATTKRARLVIFPELAGLMVAPPLLAGFHASLLMSADGARRRRVSLWQKMKGNLAGVLARSMKADFRRLLGGLLELKGAELWTAYEATYGELAKEFDLTLVAPSAYLPDPADGIVRNIAVVYGPGGERLGYQAKGILHPEDEDLAQPGAEWNVIQTDVGRIGLMLGGDVLYPEIGRLLAYQGAEILVAQGAATERVLYEKLRAGMLARMQDNQLFGAISFLVGHNEFSRRQRDPFAGKSAILAPQELTPNASGVLVESANFRSESVMAAVWDFPALANLWETSDTPVRSRLPMEKAGAALAQLYQKMEQLPRMADLPALTGPAVPSARSLDELPVLASVTARWPLEKDAAPPDTDDTDDLDAADRQDTGSRDFLHAAHNSAEQAEIVPGGDDETQEMDVLLEPKEEEN
ncbi:MAG: nitrilase-related carbon-nitrogen hydrolase [Caldilineaceae bacterium]